MLPPISGRTRHVLMSFTQLYRNLDRNNPIRRLVGRVGRPVVRAFRRGKAVVRHPLHRETRLRALTRSAYLHFVSRISPGPITIPYVEGAVLVWPREASSVSICADFGLGEFEDMAFCLHALRPGDLFCDVGANSGVYTVLASKAAGAHTVAMEPVPETFALLMQNIWANGIASLVDARQCGVGREDGKLHFTASQWSFNHVVPEPGENTVEVPVTSLDKLLDGRVPQIVKIDVEGFEGEVVAGARRTLSDTRCFAVILELVGALKRYGGDRSSIEGQMADFGLRPFWYDPFKRELITPGKAYDRRYNIIFVRDVDSIGERIKASPAWTVNGTTF